MTETGVAQLPARWRRSGGARGRGLPPREVQAFLMRSVGVCEIVGPTELVAKTYCAPYRHWETVHKISRWEHDKCLDRRRGTVYFSCRECPDSRFADLSGIRSESYAVVKMAQIGAIGSSHTARTSTTYGISPGVWRTIRPHLIEDARSSLSGTACPAPAERAVSINKYLTPFDWAVVVSLAVADRQRRRASQPQPAEPVGREPAPDFRILILDLASQSVAAADSVWFFSHLRQPHLPGLSWVHVFRPVGDHDRPATATTASDILPIAVLAAEQNYEDSKAAAKLDEPEAKKADADKACLKFFSQCDANKRDSDLERIQRIWGSSLARPATPDEHHSIANLAGPLLLRQLEAGTPHEQALQTLLERLVLVSARDEQQPVLLAEPRGSTGQRRVGRQRWRMRSVGITVRGIPQMLWGVQRLGMCLKRKNAR